MTGQLSLERLDRPLESLTLYPACAIDERVEILKRFRLDLDIELGVAAGAIAPLLALQYDLDAGLYGVLALSLLLGTPVLSLIGGIGAALTLGVRGGGVLLALLVLPLYVPVLVMGAGSVEMASAGLGGQGQLLILGAMLIVAVAFAPWATAAALRISSE